MRQFADLKSEAMNTVAQPKVHKDALPEPVRSSETHIQNDFSVSRPEDQNEREADRTADQVLSNADSSASRLAINPLTGQTSNRHSEQRSGDNAGSPLSRSQREYFEPQFGEDLSTVRLHSGQLATTMSETIEAQAFTHGQDIYFGADALNSDTVKGRRLMAHEIAHTLQNGAAQTTQLQRSKVSSLAKSVRDDLRISRAAPKPDQIADWVKNYFDPKKGTSSSTGIPVAIDPVITDTQQKKGLTSIAAELVDASRASVNPKLSDQPLASNSILDVDIDPSAHGGIHAIYRFIRYTEAKTEKIYIEKMGTATTAQSNAPVKAVTPQPRVAGATKEADKAPIDRTSVHGMVPVGAINVDIASGFGRQEARTIIASVQQIPASTRSKINGIEFVHSSKATSADGAAGEYEPIDDEITLYTSAFTANSRKVGGQSAATYAIVHEIGHAIDLRPEYEAERETKKAKAEKKKLERIANRVSISDSNDPMAGIMGNEKPDPAKQKAKQDIAKLDKKISDLSRKLGRGKSLSGEEVGKNTESLKTEFGVALKKDGIKAVRNAKKTNKASQAYNKANPTLPQKAAVDNLSRGVSLYGNTDLMEAFAENFTYYTLDPDLLKSIRPHTYAYFAKNFPKPAPARGTP